MSWKTDKFQALTTSMRAERKTSTAKEYEARVNGVLEQIRKEVHEARQVAEITRELRGEPEPAHDHYRPMRYSYGIAFSVKRDQSVVCIAGI
jgi:hypothetical protein